MKLRVQTAKADRFRLRFYVVAGAVLLIWGFLIVGCAPVEPQTVGGGDRFEVAADVPFPDQPDITWPDYCGFKKWECERGRGAEELYSPHSGLACRDHALWCDPRGL